MILYVIIIDYAAQILHCLKSELILWYNYIKFFSRNWYIIIAEFYQRYIYPVIKAILNFRKLVKCLGFILFLIWPTLFLWYVYDLFITAPLWLSRYYTNLEYFYYFYHDYPLMAVLWCRYPKTTIIFLLTILWFIREFHQQIKEKITANLNGIKIKFNFINHIWNWIRRNQHLSIHNTIVFALFILVIKIWLSFDKTWPGYQSILCSNFFWTSIQIDFGIDGMSLSFLSLTTFIFALIFFYMAFDKTISRSFLYTCIIIEIFLILSFYTTNLLLFYIFFESVLIPMFLMIIYWGSSRRRIKAAVYFLLYTIVGSIFLLYAILYIYNIIGTLHYAELNSNLLTPDEEIILWIAFFLPFAVKIPMFPFHIWLPEAHVEAPTVGSIILASLLLKLGGYGMLRFTIPMFPYANEYFLPLVYMLGITSILNASLTALRQSDIKRVIAYSSIAHMNLIVLGIFTNNNYGQNGAVYLMIGHGLVSTALFFCVGVLYDRFHTRLIQYYGGLMQLMPKFVFNFLILSFANMGFPGTINFVGEFLILLGVMEENFLCGMIAAISTVLSAIYSIYLFNRISFGTIKVYIKLNSTIDLTIIEFSFLTILSVLTIFFGIKAEYIMDLL